MQKHEPRSTEKENEKSKLQIPNTKQISKPKYQMYKTKPTDGLTGERANGLTGEPRRARRKKCKIQDS